MGEILVELADELAAEEAASGSAAEVGPGQLTIPGLTAGMPTLLKLTLTFVAVGTAALAIAFVQWIEPLVRKSTSWIPFFGTSFDRGIQHGVQALTNNVGRQYAGIDQEIGFAFNELAEEARLVGADIQGAAFSILMVARTLGRVKPKPNLAPTVKTVHQTVKAQGAKIANVTEKVTNITRIVVAAPKAIPLRRVDALEAQVQAQQVEIAQLRKQVDAKAHPSTLAQASAVTALGLAGLGLTAARCEGPRALDKALCEAGPQGIGKLKALLAFGTLYMTLPELARAEHTVAKDLAGLVRSYWQV